MCKPPRQSCRGYLLGLNSANKVLKTYQITLIEILESGDLNHLKSYFYLMSTYQKQCAQEYA